MLSMLAVKYAHSVSGTRVLLARQQQQFSPHRAAVHMFSAPIHSTQSWDLPVVRFALCLDFVLTLLPCWMKSTKSLNTNTGPNSSAAGKKRKLKKARREGRAIRRLRCFF